MWTLTYLKSDSAEVLNNILSLLKNLISVSREYCKQHRSVLFNIILHVSAYPESPQLRVFYHFKLLCIVFRKKEKVCWKNWDKCAVTVERLIFIQMNLLPCLMIFPRNTQRGPDIQQGDTLLIFLYEIQETK